MKNSLKNIILIAAFIYLGFIAIIVQTFCLRELLIIFFGNELCVGIIFAAWLFGITIGAFIVSFITDRIEYPALILVGLLLLIALILPFQFYCIRTVRLLLDIPLGQHIAFFTALGSSFLLVMPFSIIIGVAFPIACKAYAVLKGLSLKTDGASQIGWVYIWEAVGSLIGGVLFTFYLVERFSVFEILFVSNFISLFIAFLVYLFAPIKPIRAILQKDTRTLFLSPTKSLITFLVLFLLNLIATTELTTSLEEKSILKRWQSVAGKEIELLKSTDSKYGNIAIGRMRGQYSLVENGKFVSSFPDEYTYAPLAHLFLTQHPSPSEVLIIGGGIEGLIKEILLVYPIKRLSYVQLDPKVIEVLQEYLPPEDIRIIKSDPRLEIHYNDGRRFIKETSRKYDLIIINLPDPSTAMINRFYTVDFFKEVKERLNPGGVVTTRCSSAVNYFSEAVGNYTGSVYDTLSSVFRYVLVTPGTNAYFFASDEPDTVTFDINTLHQRYQSVGIESKYFISPASFEIMLPEWHIKLTESTLKERKERYLNTDLQPVTYLFNLILWDAITRTAGRTGNFFQSISKIQFRWVVIILLTFLVIRLIYLKLTQTLGSTHLKFNTLFPIFIIGFSGLSLEIIIIISFQNIFGYLYREIGFMVALFMAGLALGGFVSNRLIITLSDQKSAGASVRTPLLTIHSILLLFSLVLPYILSIIPQIQIELISRSVLFLSIIVIGVLTGMAYPVISKISIGGGISLGRTAGFIDSFDHLGAGLGAIFTGIIFIPVFGVEKTCILIALLNLLVVMFISVRGNFCHEGTKTQSNN
ncbi:MAG: hypothetical protein QME51_05345 [Planctomycetota bacterium]|nr:hypothetical protein [Planctomycetota bacterium]MDI6787777.1 hypothetical protein [Planctomycetota bacterium]